MGAVECRGPRQHALLLLLSELVGTALLVAIGCSLVIVDFGHGSPVAHVLPSAAARRALTGLLFGSVGGSIALSPVGRLSGAHINPVVTLAFWLQGRLARGLALGYVLAQLAGAVLGALVLLTWGAFGRSVLYGATTPGRAGVGVAVLGETVATCALVVALLLFVGRRRLRRYTPAIFPVLYALLVWLEAPWSGTSTNPARSLGPAVVAGVWRGWWVYWLAPVLGTLVASGIVRLLTRGTRLALEIEVAKVYHFQHDPHGLLGRRGR